jgi:hypothetical protein
MSPGRQRSRLDPCPVTCSITATSHTECGVVFAAFKGHDSPLRGQPTPASCASNGRAVHAIWWTVDAATAEDALRLLPFYVAERTSATAISDVEIP